MVEFKVRVFWGKNKVLFELLEPVIINGYEVPKGFITDFASIPKSLWNVLPPIGKHNRAVVLHDYLYDNRIGTRKQADNIMLQLMLEDGVGKLAAYLMYFGVRIGGKKWWNN